jgi:hypothetical protein
MLYEQNQWLDKWVKNADKNPAPSTTPGKREF